MAQRTCSIDGCGKPAHGRSWCHTHYEHWRRHGYPVPVRIVHLCSVDGCHLPVKGHGWCDKHYQRWTSGKDPHQPIGSDLSIEDRFWKNVKRLPSGCWVWLASVDRYGYGVFKEHGKKVAAHRWAYRHFVGPIPGAMQVDHLCHWRDRACHGGTRCWHRRCVNFENDLVLADHRENNTRSWSPSAVNLRKTHCPAGHEYDGLNVDGARICRACHRAADARYRARRLGDA